MAYTVPKLADYSQAELQRAGDELVSALRAEADAVTTEAEWGAFRDRWLARKNGILTQINNLWLKGAPAEQKREVGKRVNNARYLIEDVVAKRQGWVRTYQAVRKIIGENAEIKLVVDESGVTHVEQASKASPEVSQAFEALEKDYETLMANSVKTHLAADRLDITLPGIRRPLGVEHPILQTMNELLSVFRSMGYSIEDGPEIESDYYNFEALNFPPNHPARDTQDTLFVAGQESKPLRERLLLRTHTSPVQIRAMEKHGPPVRIVCPGKVHRHDTPDATHSPVFHQVEGLCVDTNITFCDLKGTLDYAMKAMFGSSVKTRFHPSFFPFTEPSADVSISCIFCGGKGCRICKMSGWIELLGCGMVHPSVFGFVRDKGYDPAKISGFAWGLGVERIAILKYGVDDIQLFFHGDVRFLEQFG